jgi:hypothetical protein
MVLTAWGVGHGVQPKILAIPTSKKPPPHLSPYTSHLPSDITLQQTSHPSQPQCYHFALLIDIIGPL